MHCNKFPFNKTNRCTNFPNVFWLKNEPLHVSGSSSAHHQEFVNCTLGTDICHSVWSQLTNRAEMELDGQRNCLKHVEVHFLAKIHLGN